jgi:hypothetical protein
LLDCAGWQGTLRTSAWRTCRGCDRAEVLVFALKGTLPAVAFVVAATAVIADLALLASAMLTTMVAAVASIVRPVAPTLVGEKALLVPQHTPEKLNCELIVKPEEVQLIDWEFDV